ncbi:YodL domain-containing protein [Flavonifractor plautii]|uniref:YodL domain-containing protein n=2 Tax=Clostridia TaxID=186801 RepID=UPI001FAB5D46|nr:YodL domain-containing protein [Flavonifractor plautii]
MKNEKWDDVHGNTTPDDRMVAFLESPTDSYAILQLREDVDDNIPLMFANYSYLQKKEMEPEIDRYEVVYHGSISMSEDVNRQLEDLYVKFNIDHPDDFRGHSMSVSDIVALKVVGEVSFHYVDSVGFQKLENFMKSENYLKNAEMAMEDDYGMIDGRPAVCGRKPCVQEFVPLHKNAKCGRSVHLRSPEIFGYVYEVPLYG